MIQEAKKSREAGYDPEKIRRVLDAFRADFRVFGFGVVEARHISVMLVWTVRGDSDVVSEGYG